MWHRMRARASNPPDLTAHGFALREGFGFREPRRLFRSHGQRPWLVCAIGLMGQFIAVAAAPMPDARTTRIQCRE